MTKIERAEFIMKRLDELFPNPPIPLQHKDPYTLLVAVLLSAQCTDARVNKVTPILFKKADTPLKMSKLTVAQIEEIVRPCGLGPRKAKSIFGLSKIIMEKHNGEVPDNFKDLEDLPGVGHKTASVVMSQAFNHPAFPVDTHIHRLAQQWGLTSGKSVVETESDLKKIFPKERWNDLHIQIILFGREICQARKCDGMSCPFCKTFYPNRKKAKEYKKA